MLPALPSIIINASYPTVNHNGRYVFIQLFAVLFPGVCGAPIGGVPSEPKVFLDLAGRVWVAALRLDPLLKRLCAEFVR